MKAEHLPEKIRVSVGSAIVLGLIAGKLDAPPTTVYLLTYHERKCSANCGFCPQARTSTSRADMLSRVTWPSFKTEKVIDSLARAGKKDSIQRVCIQAINYPNVYSNLLALATNIKAKAKVSLSVSCPPFTKEKMRELRDAGVDRVSVALDTATSTLFEEVKGAKAHSSYSWEKHRRTLEEAVQVFGRNSVSTHLIVGLGENEKQLVEIMQWCVDTGICPSLFAFTPVPGTVLENMNQPKLAAYRRVQLARFFMVNGKTRVENMQFDGEGRIVGYSVSQSMLEETLELGGPFQTSGCPGCNRPYYNEKPSGPIYNYPRPLSHDEIVEVKKQFGKEIS
jgi:biotin synthase-related radical SAM superfamily protein